MFRAKETYAMEKIYTVRSTRADMENERYSDKMYIENRDVEKTIEKLQG